MTQRFASKSSVLLTALLVGTVSGSVALCQPPGGGPGGRGPGGPGGFGGRGGEGRPMGGQRQSSAAQTPVSALASGLQLTDAQKTQIQTIQDNLKTQRDALMPRRGQNDGQRPDPETMQANFEKLRTAEQKANKDIEALLTAEQKTALPSLLKKLDGLRQVGIPLEVLGELNLTAAQKTKLDAIAKKARESMPQPGQGRPGDGGPGGPGGGGDPRQGGRGQGGPGGPGGFGGRGGMDANRQKFHDQAMAVLTDEQKQIVQDYMEAHPRPEGFGPGGRGPGGPGGPGGFGGRGGDGPPPPPGGEGGDNPPPPPPGGGDPPAL